MTDITVRMATLEDKDEVFKIALNAHREIGIFPFSINKFQMLWYTFAQARGGVCGVIDAGEGKLKGAVFLSVTTTYYSDDLYLSENFLFVYPEYRPSKCAWRLIDFCKDVSKTLNLKLIMGVLSNEKTQKKVDFYTRQLGAPVGATFLYEG